MKYIPIPFLIFLLLFLSCDKEEKSNNKEDSITISQSLIKIDGNENTLDLIIDASGDWLIKDVPDWVLLSSKSGSKKISNIIITIHENVTLNERNCELVLSCGKANTTVTIIQTPKEAVYVSTDSFSFSPLGGDGVVQLKSTVDYDVDIPVDWIKLLETRSIDTTLSFFVEANYEKNERQANVIISSKDKKIQETITFIQQAATITCIDKTIEVNPGGDTLEITVDANIDFQEIYSPDWIRSSVSYEQGENGIIELFVDANIFGSHRESMVIIAGTDTYSSICDTITIKQDFAYLSLSKGTASISRTGGSAGSLTLTSNIDFDINIDGDWINECVTAKYVADRYNIYIRSGANYDKERRSATVTFAGHGSASKISAKIKITQDPVRFYFDEPDTLRLSWKSSGFYVDLITDVGVDFYTTDSWLWRDKSSDVSTLYGFRRDSTYTTRVGVIVAKGSGEASSLTDTLVILQEGYIKQPIIIHEINTSGSYAHSLTISFTNNTDRVIKYVKFTGSFYNAVGDPVKCEIRQSYAFGGQVTGPINPNKRGDYYWSSAIYNNSATEFRLSHVNIEFMDGLNLFYNEQDLTSLFENK